MAIHQSFENKRLLPSSVFAPFPFIFFLIDDESLEEENRQSPIAMAKTTYRILTPFGTVVTPFGTHEIATKVQFLTKEPGLDRWKLLLGAKNRPKILALCQKSDFNGDFCLSQKASQLSQKASE